MSEDRSSTAPAEGWRLVLTDPAGTIENECAQTEIRQRDVALTYALAIRDEEVVPVDWPRINAAIRNRWPRGLDRVKTMAWKMFRSGKAEERRGI